MSKKNPESPEELVDAMIEDNNIAEKDRQAALVVWTYIIDGREAAEAISKELVKNLDENGFTEDGELPFSPNETEDEMFVELILMIRGAQNRIKRTTEGR